MFRRDTWFLRSPDGEGGDGGDPAPAPAGEGGAAPAWVQSQIEALQANTAAVREMLEFGKSRHQAAAQPAPAPVEPEEPEPDDATLETLSRGEFARHITGQVIKAVNKQVTEPINARLQEITALTTRTDLTATVERLAEKHKDLPEWFPEMQALARENPGLGPLRLYQLARIDNPTKAKELDARLSGSSGAEPAAPPRRSFGGLTPSQAGTGSKGRRMSPSEAAEAAWAETIKAFGNVPALLGED